jgi:ubiquinone/menaquinone biosynthesis C-methylase UbiE/DNA-binding transcriptional ArsR family regulator
MTLSADEMVEVLRAAGEPTRLRILALLAQEELSVMELCQILDQSQPRVSRHLKLLSEAGLIERFPDGAWVFYRPAGGGARKQLLDEVLDLLDDGGRQTSADAERLQAVRRSRTETAATYFARNAAQWDQIRSLYVAEAAVEKEIVRAAGKGPFRQLVDLGSGTGRMLTLLGPKAQSAIGLDLSQQMLNIARSHVANSDLDHCELRHGDIFATRLPAELADLVVVHQVLHYLSDPAAAVREAARLVGEGGRLLIVDFAPHQLEFLREQHQHRRLGFSDEEMERWIEAAGLGEVRAVDLPPASDPGLTVKIWTAERVPEQARSAA